MDALPDQRNSRIEYQCRQNTEDAVFVFDWKSALGQNRVSVLRKEGVSNIDQLLAQRCCSVNGSASSIFIETTHSRHVCLQPSGYNLFCGSSTLSGCGSEP
jgi:hypothetical protein